MSNWSSSNPEEAERIASLPPSEQNAAERAAMAPAVERARHLRGLSPMPLRLATDADRETAASGERIPFHVVNPSGLVAMQEFLCGEGWDVEEVVLGRALAYYFEVTER